MNWISENKYRLCHFFPMNNLANSTYWNIKTSKGRCFQMLLNALSLLILWCCLKLAQCGLLALGICWLTSHKSPERYLWSDRHISWGWCSWCWGRVARLWTAPSGRSCEQSHGWTCPCCTCPEPRPQCLPWDKRQSHNTVSHLKTCTSCHSTAHTTVC